MLNECLNTISRREIGSLVRKDHNFITDGQLQGSILTKLHGGSRLLATVLASISEVRVAKLLPSLSTSSTGQGGHWPAVPASVSPCPRVPGLELGAGVMMRRGNGAPAPAATLYSLHSIQYTLHTTSA